MSPATSPPAQVPPATSPLWTISGVVERITFVNEETGYTVARLLPDPLQPSAAATGGTHHPTEKVHVGNDQLVTIIGTLPGLVAGEALELGGHWQRHPEYGWQFLVHTYRSILPATTQGLRKYLGSGLIKGIGPRTAEKIVARFDLNTLDVLEHQQERLLEVPGLGRRRAQRIATAWEEQKAIKEVMLCLSELGVSTSLAVRIYKEYGNAAISIIKQNPYRLARDVWGIGFKTADKLALAQGYTADHPERIKAGVLFVLSEASESGGHTYLPRPHLAKKVVELLGVSLDQAEQAITSLVLERGIQAEALVVLPNGQISLKPLNNTVAAPDLFSAGGHQDRVQTSFASLLQQPDVSFATKRNGEAIHRRLALPEQQMIFLPPFYAAEQGIARHVLRLAQCSPHHGRLADFQHTNFSIMFDYLASTARLTLAERQQDGIRIALTHPVSILTGGPGTGKTTSLRALLHVLSLKKKSIIVAAPTGRAAKRLSEATGIAAKTLHRLLQLRPGDQSPYDRTNPLPADMVIVDEASMLDTLLMNTLLKAIATGTHLLLVGDADQLPSVGAGNVLADVIASEVVPVVRLEQIFRQSAGSHIALNAQRINQGHLPLTGPENTEFFFFTQEDAVVASNLVIELVAKRIPAKFGLPPEDIQVLSPMRRGRCGVAELNLRLQAALNPPDTHKAERHYGGVCFRVGDKVLQLRNNYAKEVFNGDGGRITAISLEDQTLTVRLDDERIVTYEFGELDELSLAYAISIHKAQGSEYPACVIPLAMEHYVLLERQLVYTAITRARQLVVLVGSKRALAIAVGNGPKCSRQGTDALGLASDGVRSFSLQLSHCVGRYTGLAIRLHQLALETAQC